ncbi:MAG: hypothetical protein IT364_12500 [Candidatus Hydrogenedentes bacterium]|nr:hypothetical protein [Candidatus Hydrogenedentota bacterium]
MTSITDSERPQDSENSEVDAPEALAWRRRLPVVVLFAGLAAMFTFYFCRIHDKPTILMNYIPFASARFAEDGFFAHRFTPPFPDMWSDYSASDFTVWYTHYPPLPFYIGAVLWKLGATTKVALSIFFNIVALGYVLLFYRVLSLLTNRWVACVSALVLASHPLFVEQVLENYLNLSLFFQAAAFLFLIHALNSTVKRHRYLLYLATWICLFGDAYSTFDQTLASGFIVFAYTLWRLGLKQWKRAVCIVGFMATASVTAFALHLATNAWFFGSFDAAFQDLCINALQDKSTRDTPFQDQIALRDYPAWLVREVWSYYGMSLPGVTAVAASLIWAFASERRTRLARSFFVLAGIMCVANLSYWIIFARLNYLQFQFANATQWLPTYSMLVGGALYFMAAEVRHYWTRYGLKKFVVLAPELLLLLCVYQVYLHAMLSFETYRPDKDAFFTDEIASDPTLALMSELENVVPHGAVLATTDRGALRHNVIMTPRTAFGLREFPFTFHFYKASDKSALYKLESMALTRDVYILRADPTSVSPELRRRNIIEALKEAHVPEEKWEDAIIDMSPIAVRPNWELVYRSERHGLYKIHTPTEDDLFPERAALPTRLAISGARIRDGHELQLLGWLFTAERVSRIEVRLDGKALGDAAYPTPGKALAEKNFAGMRRWFGMQDYPLPQEELEGDYPEYKDSTPRFIYIQRGLRLSPTSHTISVHAYSGETIVAEASYNFDFLDGAHRIREYFAVERSGPGSPQAG